MHSGLSRGTNASLCARSGYVTSLSLPHHAMLPQVFARELLLSSYHHVGARVQLLQGKS